MGYHTILLKDVTVQTRSVLNFSRRPGYCSLNAIAAFCSSSDSTDKITLGGVTFNLAFLGANPFSHFTLPEQFSCAECLSCRSQRLGMLFSFDFKIGFNECLGLGSTQGVSVSIQSSHSLGSPISQRECPGLNRPFCNRPRLTLQ